MDDQKPQPEMSVEQLTDHLDELVWALGVTLVEQERAHGALDKFHEKEPKLETDAEEQKFYETLGRLTLDADVADLEYESTLEHMEGILTRIVKHHMAKEAQSADAN